MCVSEAAWAGVCHLSRCSNSVNANKSQQWKAHNTRFSFKIAYRRFIVTFRYFCVSWCLGNVLKWCAHCIKSGLREIFSQVFWQKKGRKIASFYLIQNMLLFAVPTEMI